MVLDVKIFIYLIYLQYHATSDTLQDLEYSCRYLLLEHDMDVEWLRQQGQIRAGKPGIVR